MIQSVDEVRVNTLTQDQARKFAGECREKDVATLRADMLKRRKELSDTMRLAERNGEDGHIIYDFSKVEGWKDKTEGERREEFSRMNDELNLMGAVVQEQTFYNDLSNSVSRLNGANAEGGTPVRIAEPGAFSDRPRGVAELFGSSQAYQSKIAGAERVDRAGRTVDMKDIKGRDFLNAVFQRTGVSNSGWEPQIIRSGRVVYDALRPLQLVEMLPTVQAMNGGYSWVQEGALSAESTSNRVPRERAEGAAAEELTLTVTEKDVKIQRISCFIPVTDEQLMDEPGVRAYLELRLPQQVRQRLDYQAIRGNGTAPNMQGFVGVSGINTYAAPSSSRILDVFLNAADTIWEDTYMHPDLIAVPKASHTKILLSKDSDNNYLYADPASYSMANQTLWGYRLTVNDALAANTGLMLVTAEKLLVIGEGVELTYGYVGDDFKECKVSIRCVMRANFADLRPTSTCSVTALNNAS